MALELKAGQGANLLSLDGGGVKGISTLWILKTIMDRVKDIEKQKGISVSDDPRPPVEYFHMAAGTSTGGIIAIMLFRLRMTTDQAIKEYMAIGPNVFGKEADSGPAKFPAKPLIDSIDTVVATYAKTPEERKAKGNTMLVDNKAKMFLCATLQERGESVLFRSYDMPEYAQPVSEEGGSLLKVGAIKNISIKIAARATSAAPTYFPDVEIPVEGGKPVVFWDGGLLNNNPIDQLWRARLDLVANSDPAPKVACVLSLGTSWSTKGPPTVFDKWPILNSVKSMTTWPMIGAGISKLIDWITPAEESIAFLTNTEAKHLDFHRYIKRVSHRENDPDKQTQYFRFNTPTADTYIDMADYKKMQLLADITKQWLKDPKNADWVDKVATILAKTKVPT